MSDQLLETFEDGIATLTMNRPEARNALTSQLLDELAVAVPRLALDPKVRVVVLTGAGGAFCAGGDVKGFVAAPAPSAELVDKAALDFAALAPNSEGIELFGPAPAPITVLRGRHRRRFLVKSPRNIDLSAYMAAWVARLKLPAQVRLSVDIDPYSFL